MQLSVRRHPGNISDHQRMRKRERDVDLKMWIEVHWQCPWPWCFRYGGKVIELCKCCGREDAVRYGVPSVTRRADKFSTETKNTDGPHILWCAAVGQLAACCQLPEISLP
jgi:hypothetical protein